MDDSDETINASELEQIDQLSKKVDEVPTFEVTITKHKADGSLNIDDIKLQLLRVLIYDLKIISNFLVEPTKYKICFYEEESRSKFIKAIRESKDLKLIDLKVVGAGASTYRFLVQGLSVYNCKIMYSKENGVDLEAITNGQITVCLKQLIIQELPGFEFAYLVDSFCVITTNDLHRCQEMINNPIKNLAGCSCTIHRFPKALLCNKCGTFGHEDDSCKASNAQWVKCVKCGSNHSSLSCKVTSRQCFLCKTAGYRMINHLPVARNCLYVLNQLINDPKTIYPNLERAT